jgi:hypothetical protein
MGRNGLGLAVLLAGLQGCLVAPPIEREGDVNRPFTIDARAVRAAGHDGHSLSIVLGQTQQFFAIGAASDPDGDRIFTFWFVRDPTTDEILDDHTFDTYTFDPCDRRFGSDLPPQVFLEVLASDRVPLGEHVPGDDVVDETPRKTVGKYDFAEEANVVTLGWWWITITDGGSCP